MMAISSRRGEFMCDITNIEERRADVLLRRRCSTARMDQQAMELLIRIRGKIDVLYTCLVPSLDRFGGSFGRLEYFAPSS